VARAAAEWDARSRADIAARARAELAAREVERAQEKHEDKTGDKKMEADGNDDEEGGPPGLPAGLPPLSKPLEALPTVVDAAAALLARRRREAANAARAVADAAHAVDELDVRGRNADALGAQLEDEVAAFHALAESLEVRRTSAERRDAELAPRQAALAVTLTLQLAELTGLTQEQVEAGVTVPMVVRPVEDAGADAKGGASSHLEGVVQHVALGLLAPCYQLEVLPVLVATELERSRMRVETAAARLTEARAASAASRTRLREAERALEAAHDEADGGGIKVVKGNGANDDGDAAVTPVAPHDTGVENARRLAAMLADERRKIAFGKSGVHGWGLVARVPFSADTFVTEYRGEVVRRDTADAREARYRSAGVDCYLFGLDERLVLDLSLIHI